MKFSKISRNYHLNGHHPNYEMHLMLKHNKTRSFQKYFCKLSNSAQTTGQLSSASDDALLHAARFSRARGYDAPRPRFGAAYP
jgi:hypothetical protein